MKTLPAVIQRANAVKEYIIDCIDYEGNEEEKIAYFFDNFISEYWYLSNQERYGNNLQKGLANYLQGLPSTINMAFYYDEIDELLIEWKYLNPSCESERVRDTKRDQYWMLLAMALIVVARKYKIVV